MSNNGRQMWRSSIVRRRPFIALKEMSKFGMDFSFLERVLRREGVALRSSVELDGGGGKYNK